MSARIRVLFAIGSLAAGGSERQLIALLRALNRDQFAPVLFAVYGEGQLREQVPRDVPMYAFWDTHRFPRINLPGRILYQQAAAMAAWSRRQEVAVICDRNWETTLVSAVASWRTSLPRISIIGSHLESDLQARGGRYRACKKRLLRSAYRRAARVVAVSDGVRANAIEYFRLSPDRVQTIYSFVDPSHIAELAAAYEPVLAPQRFHVVAVGRLIAEKGYQFLIEAVAQLREDSRFAGLQLTIIGQGPEHDRLAAEIQQRGLSRHIQLLGYLENPFPYLRRADLYCLPSLYEGMPNALLEAVACGVPVVASDCPSGPREILDGGRHGHLVQPGDATALARAIADVMQNYSVWQARTAAARQFVEARYSLQVNMARLEQLFTEVAHRHPPVHRRPGKSGGESRMRTAEEA